MLIFLADFCTVWKKACSSLSGTSCQKMYFVPLIFVLWEIVPTTLCSPSQWGVWLYQSLPYPSQCLCWKMFQLFNLPFHISCQYSFFLGSQAHWAQGIPHPAVSWSHQVILTGSHASLCVLCRGDAGLVLNWKKTWSGGFADQLFECLVAGSPIWRLKSISMPFTTQLAGLFSMEMSFWLLQQQLIRNCYCGTGRKTVAL